FADEYAVQTEIAAKQFLGDLPTTFTRYTTSDVGAIVDSYVTAAEAIYGQCKRWPDTVWLDVSDWASLVSTLTTSEDRTALALVREAFAEMGLPSLTFVMAPSLTVNTEGDPVEGLDPTGNRVMGVRKYVEAYEQ